MHGRRLLGLGGFLALALMTSIWLGAVGASASGGLGPEGTSTKSGDGGKSGGSAFPIRGRHTYGDGLGAGRGHQGQDIMANCGKKVVAARAGRVRFVDYQASGAGHYVVVKGKGGKKLDYVYMHLLKRLSVRKGERVSAGEQIGQVGSTGRSSACHLHFEMWSAPGWYRGGDVINPKPHLKRWDRRS
jgi:murein DD-endopeptidase MepM/ murein hydrolase activator NlpD